MIDFLKAIDQALTSIPNQQATPDLKRFVLVKSQVLDKQHSLRLVLDPFGVNIQLTFPHYQQLP